MTPDFDYPVHEPHLPPLVAGRETKRHDVMICGGGPVGLALALVLAQHGFASVVIDADTTVCQGSRAICLSRRTMEILDRLGGRPMHLCKRASAGPRGAASTAPPKCSRSTCRTVQTIVSRR